MRATLIWSGLSAAILLCALFVHSLQGKAQGICVMGMLAFISLCLIGHIVRSGR